MGGAWEEWNHEKSLDWHLLQWERRQKLPRYVRNLNAVYQAHPALWQVDLSHEVFQWIDFLDSENSIISFIRMSQNADEQTVVHLISKIPPARGGKVNDHVRLRYNII